jgi:hypothetical protein
MLKQLCLSPTPAVAYLFFVRRRYVASVLETNESPGFYRASLCGSVYYQDIPADIRHADFINNIIRTLAL